MAHRGNHGQHPKAAAEIEWPMNYSTANPNLLSACSTRMIGMPWNVLRTSRSLSPVTIASAPAPTAAAKIFRSFGSRSKGTLDSSAGAIRRPSRWYRCITSDTVVPWPANRAANSFRPSTAPNSMMISAERQSVPGALNTAFTRCAGDPLQSVPEIRRLVSTTSFPRVSFGADFVHDLLDFL